MTLSLVAASSIVEARLAEASTADFIHSAWSYWMRAGTCSRWHPLAMKRDDRASISRLKSQPPKLGNAWKMGLGGSELASQSVQEQFGPVLPLIKFDDTVDVVAHANRSEYGLRPRFRIAT